MPLFNLEQDVDAAEAPEGESAGPSSQTTEDKVRNYLASLAKNYGLPNEVVLAAAQTGKQFDPERGNVNSMQVRDQHIGQVVKDSKGNPFTIGEDVKTDWRANAEAAVALLAEQHGLAEMELPPGSTPLDRAQQAYSGYQAGSKNRGRYLQTGPDGLPAAEHDRAFLANYRKAVQGGNNASAEGRETSSPPALPRPQTQNPSASTDRPRPRDETPLDLSQQPVKLPRPEQVIQEVTESPEYKALGAREGNKRAQMLFDALAQKYGNMAATYHMAEFAEKGSSDREFEGFTVGTKPGRNAARHFFWSAVIAGESNSALAWLAGLAKEGYDLLGQILPGLDPRLALPGAGHPAYQDVAANAAGRRFVREMHRRQQGLPFLQFDRSAVNLSDYTQF